LPTTFPTGSPLGINEVVELTLVYEGDCVEYLALNVTQKLAIEGEVLDSLYYSTWGKGYVITSETISVRISCGSIVIEIEFLPSSGVLTLANAVAIGELVRTDRVPITLPDSERMFLTSRVNVRTKSPIRSPISHLPHAVEVVDGFLGEVVECVATNSGITQTTNDKQVIVTQCCTDDDTSAETFCRRFDPALGSNDEGCYSRVNSNGNGSAHLIQRNFTEAFNRCREDGLSLCSGPLASCGRTGCSYNTAVVWTLNECSLSPTSAPSVSPIASMSPSIAVTLHPSSYPSISPQSSTVSPSPSPTVSPSSTLSPSPSPTPIPTSSPSLSPTAAPLMPDGSGDDDASSTVHPGKDSTVADTTLTTLTPTQSTAVPTRFISAPPSTAPTDDTNCVDLSAGCGSWADVGFCHEGKDEAIAFMVTNCARSCGMCGGLETTLAPTASPQRPEQASTITMTFSSVVLSVDSNVDKELLREYVRDLIDAASDNQITSIDMLQIDIVENPLGIIVITTLRPGLDVKIVDEAADKISLEKASVDEEDIHVLLSVSVGTSNDVFLPTQTKTTTTVTATSPATKTTTTVTATTRSTFTTYTAMACIPMENNCLRCLDDLSQCQTCRSRQFLYRGNCVDKCPAHTTKRGTGNTRRWCQEQTSTTVTSTTFTSTTSASSTMSSSTTTAKRFTKAPPTTIVPETTPPQCFNFPFKWKDKKGHGCTEYTKRNLCNKTGYGPGWVAPKSFAFYAAQGFAAPDACCACGGGKLPSTISESEDSKSQAMPTKTKTIVIVASLSAVLLIAIIILVVRIRKKREPLHERGPVLRLANKEHTQRMRTMNTDWRADGISAMKSVEPEWDEYNRQGTLRGDTFRGDTGALRMPGVTKTDLASDPSFGRQCTARSTRGVNFTNFLNPLHSDACTDPDDRDAYTAVGSYQSGNSHSSSMESGYLQMMGANSKSSTWKPPKRRPPPPSSALRH